MALRHAALGGDLLTHVAGGAEKRDLLERICVRPPYFALEDIDKGELTLEASARADTFTDREFGPMSAAELGRHAAIAGLCCAAAAQADSRQRYYLARSAECAFFVNDAPFGSAVRFRASRASSVSAKCARAFSWRRASARWRSSSSATPS